MQYLLMLCFLIAAIRHGEPVRTKGKNPRGMAR